MELVSLVRVLNIFFIYGQRGTTVDKLIEEVVKNDQHLRHLISICEGNAL